MKSNDCRGFYEIVGGGAGGNGRMVTIYIIH